MNTRMYIVLDEKMDWIYTIVDDYDEARSMAMAMNEVDDLKYHHYVVLDCSKEYGRAWLAALRRVI